METLDLSKLNWMKKKENGMEVNLKVYPGSSETSIGDVKSGRIRIRISSNPEGGNANREILKLFSSKIKVDESKITLIRGGKSSKKTLFVEGNTDELEKALKHIK